MGLLDGIDQVAWSWEDVPELLRVLVDPSTASAEFRREAERDQGSVLKQAEFLLCDIIDDGNGYEEALRLIPFLSEIARAESLPLDTREFALDYLEHIVVGSTRWPAKVDLTKRAGVALSCVDAIEREVPRLVPLLETELAASTVGLLATLGRMADSTAPHLWKMSKARVGDPVGAMALVALARLDQPRVSNAARVMCDAINGAHVGMVYAAVADLLTSPGESVSALAVNTLLNVPEAWAKSRSPFDSTVESMTHALRGWLPRSARAELIKRMTTTLPTLAPNHKRYALTEMIMLVELDGELPLDALHREVIRLIVEHYPWSDDFGKKQFFEEARLPSDRYRLQLMGRG